MKNALFILFFPLCLFGQGSVFSPRELQTVQGRQKYDWKGAALGYAIRPEN